MTPINYRDLRQQVGTQAAAARVLGVSRSTVVRREDGSIPITTEAALALIALSEHWPSVPMMARPPAKSRAR